MLQIRLSKPATDTGGGSKSAPSESVTVACPDHLVIADLPVAKSLGTPFSNAVVKNLGRRSRRQLGERVHFCVQCDFPIAIYGRLIPCEHAFCLDCARSDSVCYLCDERIQKIQTIKMMEGLFICAAPNCFKSFLKKNEFECHINETHSDLLQNGKDKEGNEFEVTSFRKSSGSEFNLQASTRSVFSPSPNDYDDKTQQSQIRDHQVRPFMIPNPAQRFPAQLPYQQNPDINQYHLPGRAVFGNSLQQSGGFQSDSVNQNSSSVPVTQYGYGMYSSDPTQQYYAGAPYESGRIDSAPLPSFPPGPPVQAMNAVHNYPQSWNTGPVPLSLDAPSPSPVTPNGFQNLDPQGRGFIHNDYVQNMGNFEARQSGRTMDPRDVKRVLAPRHPAPSMLPNLQRGRGYPSDGNRDATPPGFIWHSEKQRDGFGSGLD